MANITVHLPSGTEVQHAGVKYNISDGAALVVEEESGSRVVYSPSGWAWLEDLRPDSDPPRKRNTVQRIR